VPVIITNNALRFRAIPSSNVTGKCHPKTICPHPNGHCCAPTFLLCCKYGCVKGVQAASCLPPPSTSPQRAQFDTTWSKWGEADYRDQIAKVALQEQKRHQNDEVRKQKELLTKDQVRWEKMQRDVTHAQQVAQQKAILSKQLKEKMLNAKNKEQDRKHQQEDLELALRVQNREGYHSAAFKIVDSFCHLGGTVTRGPDIQGILANLRETCRPSSRLVFNALVGQAETVRLDVLDNGVITFVGGQGLSTWVSFDAMTLYTGGSPDLLELPEPWVAYQRGFMDPSYKQHLIHGAAATCYLYGLMRVNNWAVSDWQDHLGTVPTECRPSHRLIFLVNQHESSLRVDITPEGMILYISGDRKHAWVSLSGIRYITNMTKSLELSGDWRPYSSGSSSDMRKPMWEKHNQVCLLSGVVKGSGGENSRTIAVLPRECQPTATLVFGVAAFNSMAILHLKPDGKLIFTAHTSKTFPGIWISLDGISYVVP